MNQHVEIVRGTAGSGLTLTAYIVSKATDVEALQYASLVIGVLTGGVTLVYMSLKLILLIRNWSRPAAADDDE